VFADMHDGDEKVVSISDGSMTITSANATQTWKATTDFDCATRTAMVDFDVPGKDDHPPVPIQATMYKSLSADSRKTTFVYTDTSGQLVDDSKFPLNQWVAETSAQGVRRFQCPEQMSLVFQDMHDGDKKHVEIKGEAMTITPADSDAEWIVNTKFDQKSCSASVDFNVPGKDDHPPVPLLATYWMEYATKTDTRQAFEFTDPSGTLADASMPLNRWIGLAAQGAQGVVGSCGGDQPSKVADCQNVDFGSCGGACCKLDFRVSGSTDAVMDALNKTLSNGGPDGAYELQMTAEGTLGFGDLTQFGSPQGTDWIGQAFHTTSGPAHYVDTLNFNIKSERDGAASLVRAFSLSQIGGALGDNGQNYKNVMTLMKAAFGDDIQGSSVDGSCPAASVVV